MKSQTKRIFLYNKAQLCVERDNFFSPLVTLLLCYHQPNQSHLELKYALKDTSKLFYFYYYINLSFINVNCP
jgi:hypothetical protein